MNMIAAEAGDLATFVERMISIADARGDDLGAQNAFMGASLLSVAWIARQMRPATPTLIEQAPSLPMDGGGGLARDKLLDMFDELRGDVCRAMDTVAVARDAQAAQIDELAARLGAQDQASTSLRTHIAHAERRQAELAQAVGTAIARVEGMLAEMTVANHAGEIAVDLPAAHQDQPVAIMAPDPEAEGNWATEPTAEIVGEPATNAAPDDLMPLALRKPSVVSGAATPARVNAEEREILRAQYEEGWKVSELEISWGFPPGSLATHARKFGWRWACQAVARREREAAELAGGTG